MTGINQGRLSDMEGNKTKPSFGALEAIKKAYPDISLDWLISGNDMKNDNIQNRITIKENPISLTIDESNLLNFYRKTTDNGKILIQETVTEIWAENKRCKSKLSSSPTDEISVDE